MKKEELFQSTLTSALEELGVTRGELQSGSRYMNVVDARSIVAALLKEEHGALQVDIASLLGTSQAAVSKMLARHRTMMRYNKPYRQKWESLNN